MQGGDEDSGIIRTDNFSPPTHTHTLTYTRRRWQILQWLQIYEGLIPASIKGSSIWPPKASMLVLHSVNCIFHCRFDSIYKESEWQKVFKRVHLLVHSILVSMVIGGHGQGRGLPPFHPYKIHRY